MQKAGLNTTKLSKGALKVLIPHKLANLQDANYIGNAIAPIQQFLSSEIMGETRGEKRGEAGGGLTKQKPWRSEASGRPDVLMRLTGRQCGLRQICCGHR